MIAMVLETVLCGPIEDNGTVTCHRTNLHGQYGNNNFAKGISQEDWLTLEYSLKRSTMKARGGGV